MAIKLLKSQKNGSFNTCNNPIGRLIVDHTQINVKRCLFIILACLRKKEKGNFGFFLSCVTFMSVTFAP